MAPPTSASSVEWVKSVSSERSVRSVADDSGRTGRWRVAVMAMVEDSERACSGRVRRGGGGIQLDGMSFPRPGSWRRSDRAAEMGPGKRILRFDHSQPPPQRPCPRNT